MDGFEAIDIRKLRIKMQKAKVNIRMRTTEFIFYG